MLVILKKVLVQSIMIWIILARILVIIYFLRCLVAGPLEINSKVAVILWAWELLTQVLQVQRIDNTHPWCWCCLRFLRNTCYWNGNTRSHRTGKLWSTSGTQGSLHALEKSCSRRPKVHRLCESGFRTKEENCVLVKIAITITDILCLKCTDILCGKGLCRDVGRIYHGEGKDDKVGETTDTRNVVQDDDDEMFDLLQEMNYDSPNFYKFLKDAQVSLLAVRTFSHCKS
ncbi:hypothetical protein C5167_003502 [Papaver somniferum]|uniref:Uncharacterized protein n=1 Tax=Papaver somniferum TaxID=3469 RepID=A0A4Y7L536_PAPSO|nr:hypothetical protein C5167_003502 [Papaver somniferum]